MDDDQMKVRPVFLFFTGPSGAGKTTVAAAWARKRNRPTAIIDDDQVRSFVRVGERSAEAAALSASDRITQYNLSGAVSAAMAAQYIDSGVDCAIVSQRSPHPPAEWSQVWVDADLLRPTFVVLLPSLEVCIERNRIRDGLSDETIAANYKFGWDGWAQHPNAFIIDSSAMSIDEVVEAVDCVVIQSQVDG